MASRMRWKKIIGSLFRSSSRPSRYNSQSLIEPLEPRVLLSATIGGGAINDPALGAAPLYNVGEGQDFVLVKNWDFGTTGDSTITDQAVMNNHFMYHDQFGVYNNGGGNYGANIVAPDAAHALSGQPVEGVNTSGPVREFNGDALRTYLVPLDDATQVHPTYEKAGSGSFQATWTLPNGGSRLGQNMLWETRVRYVTPPYFWFAIWTCGNKWSQGAEIDTVESFGYDNGGGYTNFDGDYWHADSVGGTDETDYSSWANGMASNGITNYDATQWHTWSLLYRTDDSFSIYVDGIEVQSGDIDWTYKATADGEPINMSFIFDGSWGHSGVDSVNHWLDASAFDDVYYDWDYSRVYLADDIPATPVDVTNASFETGDLTGWTVASSGGYGSGVNVVDNIANQQNQYPTFSDPLPGDADGDFYASLRGYGTDQSTYIYQNIGQLKANTTYILKAAIGVGRYDTNPPEAHLSLINGTDHTGTVLATADVSTLGLNQYANDFEDLVVTFKTGDTVSGDLSIAIETVGGYSSISALRMDNVRLSEYTEPATGPIVTNADFEEGDLTGWTVTASGGWGSGASVTDNVANQQAQYPVFSDPLPGTASGQYYASLRGYGADLASFMYQDVGELQPYTEYTLTAAIGVGRYDFNPPQGTLYLINGSDETGTVLASADFSSLGMSQYANNFMDLDVTFTTDAIVTGDLTIAFETIGGYTSISPVRLDHVRLTAVEVEPQQAVVNGDFENGDTTGWTTVSSGGWGSGSGVIDNVADQQNQYPSFDPLLPGTASGSHYATLRGYGADQSSFLYQNVGGLLANTTYTLTVAIGVGRFDYNPPNGVISLVNGNNQNGSILASSQISSLGMGQYAHNFMDLTVSYTTGSSVIDDLTIVIETVGGYSSINTLRFDNVRLTLTPVA